MTKLIDTVVIVGSLNPASKIHGKCLLQLNKINSDDDIFVPSVALLETDLVMKGRGYSYKERKTSWRALRHKIQSSKIVPNSVPSIYVATSLQEKGLDYFDSLITSLALERRAEVITTDRAIAKVVKTAW